MKRTLLAVLLLLTTAAFAPAQAGPHTIAVTLDYDFTVDNACSATVTVGCLKQFNIYDLNPATPVLLFSIPAPAGATALVTGITGPSGALTLKAGVHTFGATAQMADGTESDPKASTALATVKPGAPIHFSVGAVI